MEAGNGPQAWQERPTRLEKRAEEERRGATRRRGGHVESRLVKGVSESCERREELREKKRRKTRRSPMELCCTTAYLPTAVHEVEVLCRQLPLLLLFFSGTPFLCGADCGSCGASSETVLRGNFQLRVGMTAFSREACCVSRCDHCVAGASEEVRLRAVEIVRRLRASCGAAEAQAGRGSCEKREEQRRSKAHQSVAATWREAERERERALGGGVCAAETPAPLAFEALRHSHRGGFLAA